MTEIVKAWFLRPSSVGKATILLMVTMTVSNVLGLARNIILSKNISLNELDAYYAAFNIPDLVFNLLVLGAISSALIPIFSELMLKKDNDTAWRVINNFLNVSVIILLIIIFFAFLFMDPLIKILTVGFTPEKHKLTVELARIVLISPLLFAVSYIVGSVLNSYKNFASYSIAPLLYNLSIIIGAILAPKFNGVYLVAWSVIVGAFIHLLIQVPAVLSSGWRHKFVFDLQDKYLHRIYKLMIPRSLGLGITQLNFIAFTVIGSTMEKGAIAIYKLTSDLQTTPIVIFGTSIAIAAFPYLSEKANANDKIAVKNLVIKAVRITLLLLIPSAVFCIILRQNIIPLYLALGHDTVNRADTLRAVNTFAFLSVAIISQGLIGIFARVFYAFQDTVKPMYFSIVSTVFSIVLAIVLKYNNWDVSGLALAFSAGSVLNCILLYVFSKKYLEKKISPFGTWQAFSKICLASIIAGFISWLVLKFLSSSFQPISSGIPTDRVVGLTLITIISLAVGVLSYYLILLIFKAEELLWIKNRKQIFTKI